MHLESNYVNGGTSMKKSFEKVKITSKKALAYAEGFNAYRNKLAERLRVDAKGVIADDVFISGVKAAAEVGIDVSFTLARLGVVGVVWTNADVRNKVFEWEYGNNLPNQEERQIAFEGLAGVLLHT